MSADAWDTDLGRWALAWRDYRAGRQIEPAPAAVVPDAPSPAERCPDEEAGNAAAAVWIATAAAPEAQS